MPDGPGAKTFMEEQEAARLDTICGGNVPDLWQREFDAALLNALDVNTPFKTKRKVILEVTLETDEARESIRVSAVTRSKLAPFLGESGIVFAAKRGSTVVAVNYRADQLKLPLGELAVRGVVKDPAPAIEPAAQKVAQ